MGGWKNILKGSPSDEQGFTLLEGMLAAVFLGIGVLALAAMQGMALVKNVDAREMTRVTTLAADMMERIQFNRRNVATYDGIAIDTKQNPTTGNNSATDCNSPLLTTSQPQAKGDCLLWSSLVRGAQLKDVMGTVAVSNVINPVVLGQRTVAVTVTWSDSNVARTRSVTLNRTVSVE